MKSHLSKLQKINTSIIMDKNYFMLSALISYVKLIFHSTLIEIYGAFNINVPFLYEPANEDILNKYSIIFFNSPRVYSIPSFFPPVTIIFPFWFVAEKAVATLSKVSLRLFVTYTIEAPTDLNSFNLVILLLLISVQKLRS